MLSTVIILVGFAVLVLVAKGMETVSRMFE